MSFKNIKLVVEYDGTNFSGFQIQEGERTVQQELTKAIIEVTGEDIRLISAGRTDSGVHAYGQIVNFLTTTKINPNKFHYHLLKYLPEDIKVVDSNQEDMYFHSRFCAKNKTYHYLINTSENMHPIYRNYMENITYKLNYEKLKEGFEILKGEHDFKAFMLRDKDDIINTIRKIEDCYFFKKKDILVFVFRAESFLHNQVRIMSGVLVEYARGKLTKDKLLAYFDKENEKMACPTLKAAGLYLKNIEY